MDFKIIIHKLSPGVIVIQLKAILADVLAFLASTEKKLKRRSLTAPVMSWRRLMEISIMQITMIEKPRSWRRIYGTLRGIICDDELENSS